MSLTQEFESLKWWRFICTDFVFYPSVIHMPVNLSRALVMHPYAIRRRAIILVYELQNALSRINTNPHFIPSI